MRDAVLAGLDGVGIGTSLHFIDAETKLMGALRAEKIAEALVARDAAERSPMGRSAVLLARADRMYFEGTLPAYADVDRRALFQAIVNRDEASALSHVERLQEIDRLPTDADHPVVEHARRFVHAAGTDSLLHSRLGSAEVRELVGDVRRLLATEDLPLLAEILTVPSSV